MNMIIVEIISSKDAFNLNLIFLTYIIDIKLWNVSLQETF